MNYERFPLYGCNFGAVSPWKGLRRGAAAAAMVGAMSLVFVL